MPSNLRDREVAARPLMLGTPLTNRVNRPPDGSWQSVG